MGIFGLARNYGPLLNFLKKFGSFLGEGTGWDLGLDLGKAGVGGGGGGEREILGKRS